MKQRKATVPAISSNERITTDADALYRSVFESLTEFAVFVVSPAGVVMSWNIGAQQTFGYDAVEIIGKNFSLIFTAEDIASGAPARELETSLSGEQSDHDRWHVRKNGTRFWGTNTVEPMFDKSHKLLGFTKLVRDITESHIALEAVSDSEQRLRLLIESVHDYAIFSVALDGTILSWNAGAQTTFGYEDGDVIGRSFAMFQTTENMKSGLAQRDLKTATSEGSCSTERWLVRKNGTKFLASAKLSQLIRSPDGQLRGFVMIAHDITEQNRLADDMLRRASSDQLTNLPNRATFYEGVARAIATMKRRPAHLFAVMFIDLDHFKAVNDTYGHLIADQLLEFTARRLEQCVRSRDILARLGGDEFAILLNGINGIVDAIDAGNRIAKEMSQSSSIEGYDVRVTASVGIAMGTLDYTQPEAILEDADSAMYVAKTQGRARSVVFQPFMKEHSRQTLDFESELRGALERDELRVEYQPIVKLPEHSIVGFEALVRWDHPRRGLLAPREFIATAESTDAIIAIDRWVIAVACRQLKAWQSLGIGPASLEMSVNLSSKQFSHNDLVDVLRQTLAETGVSPQSLRLEITETGIIERSSDTAALMADIRALGISLHIDDFGMGYASLESLSDMPVQALKIDRLFIGRMQSANGNRLVSSLVRLGHNLGLAVIAEGVETREQLDQVERFDCDFAQGYFFSKPLDASASQEFLAAGVGAG